MQPGDLVFISGDYFNEKVGGACAVPSWRPHDSFAVQAAEAQDGPY